MFVQDVAHAEPMAGKIEIVDLSEAEIDSMVSGGNPFVIAGLFIAAAALGYEIGRDYYNKH